MSLLNNRRRIIMAASQASYEHDVEGSFPLTFNSNGKPLSLYELEGTTSQNGTPGTAQVRTNQLFNKDSKDVNNGYMTNMVFDSEGAPTESSIEDSYDISEYIDITGFNYVAFNAEATSLNGIFVVMYTANKDNLGGYDASVVRTMGHIPIIGPAPKYIRFVINKSSVDNIMVNSGETSLPYEPYYKTVIVPVPVNGTGDRTENIIDENDLLSGYWSPELTIVASNSKVYKSFKIDLPQGTYTLSSEYKTRVIRYDIDGTYSTDSKVLPWTFTVSEPQPVYVSFRLESNENWTGWAMLNEGSTALPYEPYGYKIPILTNGKNLFDIYSIVGGGQANSTDGVNNTYGYVSDAKYISNFGYYGGSSVLKGQIFALKNGDTLTVSCDVLISADYPQNIDTIYLGLRKYDGSKSVQLPVPNIERGVLTKISRTLTIAENGWYCLGLLQGGSSSKFTNLNCTFSNIQLELGTTATAYEPYTETTTTIYTDRQLYSGDKISYPENERTNKTGVLTFKGDEVWRIGNNCFILYGAYGTSPLTVSCTHYKGTYSRYRDDLPDMSCMRTINQNQIAIKHLALNNDVDAFKAYLTSEYAKGTPVTVYYPLETATTEPITLPEIPTLKGTNVMSVQTEVQPSHGYIRFSNNVPRVKMDDYLYDASYSKLNYTWAKEFLRLRYSNRLGECSTVYKDGLFGRNYDWNYNESVYFFTKISKSKTVKYSSKGICGGFSELTKSFIESGKSSELYKVLPYVMLDGINECGVVASVNVVSNDYGTTTGTVPTEYTEETLSTMMLVRYILDNFATAAEAVDYIEKHVSIHSPNGATSQLPFALLENAFDQEIHIMVADKTSTYILEFVENELKVIRDKNYMTNFHLYNTSVDSSGHIDASTVAPYGTGLERYNIIADNYESVNSVSTMTDLMLKLNFTNAYKSTTNPVWKTEFAGTTPERTVTADISVYQDIINSARAAFLVRARNGILWQTVHTTVYDTNTGEMYIITQESGKDKQIRRL